MSVISRSDLFSSWRVSELLFFEHFSTSYCVQSNKKQDTSKEQSGMVLSLPRYINLVHVLTNDAPYRTGTTTFLTAPRVSKGRHISLKIIIIIVPDTLSFLSEGRHISNMSCWYILYNQSRPNILSFISFWRAPVSKIQKIGRTCYWFLEIDMEAVPFLFTKIITSPASQKARVPYYNSVGCFLECLYFILPVCLY